MAKRRRRKTPTRSARRFSPNRLKTYRAPKRLSRSYIRKNLFQQIAATLAPLKPSYTQKRTRPKTTVLSKSPLSAIYKDIQPKRMPDDDRQHRCRNRPDPQQKPDTQVLVLLPPSSHGRLYQMLGSIISGIGSIAGGLIGSDSAKKDRKQQKEFAKKSIGWRADDAEAAGLHRLVGATGQSTPYTPVGDGGMGSAVSQAGQSLGNAVSQAPKSKPRNCRWANPQSMSIPQTSNFYRPKNSRYSTTCENRKSVSKAT